MNLSLAWQIARRELRGGLHGFRVFLACLALGVAAIAALGTVRAGIEAGLRNEGAALLGGDAEVELTYRYAVPDESAWMQSIATQISETVDFRSLVVVERDVVERGLTQVRAVDNAYPLIGSVSLEPPMPLDTALADKGAVMEPVLADRLGLRTGDTFKLGEQAFTLRAILTRYPDNASGGFGFGPRTIVLSDDLAQSGLLAEGTLFSTQYRLTLPDGANLEALKTEADEKFADKGLRWRDKRRGAGGTQRFVERIGSFLILMGLAGLAVGGVGVSSAVRTYLAGKTRTIATLKTLGATRSTVFQVYFIEIGILTLIGIAIGLIFGAGLPIIFAPLIEAQLPLPADFRLRAGPLFEAALYGGLTALIFTLWPLARSEGIKPATLFRDADDDTQLPRWRYIIAVAILIALLLASASWLSGTVFLTLWTAGGIAVTLVLLYLAATLIRWIARRASRVARGRPTLRHALSAIATQRGDVFSVVLSLGLGLTVLATVGQIDGNLRAAFQNDLPEVAPSYFFIDIQPSQIDGFNARLADDPLVSKVDTAPMLRGIITQINGTPADEYTNGHWVTRGDRGVTYADGLPKGTTVTAGEWWPEGYNGPPLMSFAAEEAAEMGIGIGDDITVNILGRDITAKISSLREVSWEDAGIGFVMALNESALAGAPHSWIATVYADAEAEAPILRDLAGLYPNITAIRIRDAIDQIVDLASGIATATRYGAAVTLLTGFLVLIGAAAAGERTRTFEAAVLKTLGATRRTILLSFALRSALLGIAAGIVALFSGMLGGWAVTTFVMDGDYRVIWGNATLIISIGMITSLLAGLAFALRPLAAKPAQVLRGRE